MLYVKFFLGVVWYTLGAVVICGLAVSLCRTLFVRLLGGGFGRGVVMATSILGTPIHEGGHALMCLLFAHRITDISLWSPRSTDGTLGHVTHAYNPKNPYQVLGNLFIGVGPVFSGLGVLTLILWLCFPTALSDYITAARTLVADGASLPTLLVEGLRLLPGVAREALTSPTVPLWARIVGLVGLLAVSLHIELSPADLRGALRAIPLYLLLVLATTGICALLGESAMTATAAALATFSACVTALFLPVLIAALAQVVLALPVALIRLLLRR